MNSTRALVGVHAAVLLFGFAGLFGRWLDLPPTWIVLGRTAIAAAALGAVAAIRRTPRVKFDPRLIVNGVVLAAHWVAFFAAVQLADVATGLLGFASFPLFVLILERMLLGQRWSPRQAATGAVVTAGLALLVPELSWSNRIVQGLVCGILSGFTFALLAVMNRRWVVARTALNVAFWQNCWAALALLPLCLAGAVPTIDARAIGLLLALGLVCTALAHTLFIDSLRILSAHTASIVAALEPVYGIALAALLLGEIPGWRTLAGAALIVGAAMFATRYERAVDPAQRRN